MKLVNISKKYITKESEVIALDNINLDIDLNQGGFYAIMGHSGSGKTTLMQILGMIDTPSDGTYYFDKVDINKISENNKAMLRNKKIGFVFQSFYLNKNLTALENVIIPMIVNNDIKKNERKKIATELLISVGLEKRLNHLPTELSGGEMQRVAIARSLANSPDVILADEPTGNLDEKNEKKVLDILKKISLNNKTVIVVSHNSVVLNYADKIYRMKDGKFLGEKE